MHFLNIIQRAIEPLPIRGKVRLAEAILRHVRSREVECHPLPGITVSLRTNQRIERWMWAGAYERELVHLMKRTLKSGMTVIDVGANIGYLSALAAGLVGNTGQVHAFVISDDLKCRVDVDIIRLDDWVHDHAINRVDFVKMDIEGGEFHALRGAQEMLSRFRPIIVAELNAVCLARDHRKPEDVFALLLGLGYECSAFNDGILAIPQIPLAPQR